MVYRINGPEAHEYLLLENRQLQGFDSALPGAGLLVYQVDAEQIAALRSANSINAYAHQGLRVLAAGGETNTASAVFPGSLQVTQLTDEGTPARSEEHTSELQSRPHLVCRLLLEKKKKKTTKDS